MSEHAPRSNPSTPTSDNTDECINPCELAYCGGCQRVGASWPRTRSAHIEVADGALEPVVVGLDAAHGLLEHLPGLAQAAACGLLGDAEEHAELGAGQVLPVVELEDHLGRERDLTQRMQQQPLLAARREERVGAGAEVDYRQPLEVQLGGRPPLTTELVA